MALVVPDCGELILNDWALKSTGENLVLKLYKNDVTPSSSSVAGDYVVADFTGYSNKTLTRASWGSASTVGGKATSTYADQTWTAGSSQTVYGVYVVAASAGTLVYAERFGTPRALVDTDTITYSPKFTGSSEN